MSRARVDHLEIVGDADAWRALGLTVSSEGRVPFMFTSLQIVAGAEPGIVGWALSGIDADVTSIDGLPTRVVAEPSPTMAEHPNGAIELDHVVVLTSSLNRTCAAIEEATGAPLKRVREVGTMRQGFHRVGTGGLIVEVVERPEVTSAEAVFWGVVINVRDLDTAVEMIGSDRIGAAKDAVQPGRRIATVRGGAGLGAAVALMSP